LALAHEALEVALLGAGEALADRVDGLARGLAGLDVLGQARLVVLGQQLVPTDVFQVQPDEILVVPFGAITYSCHGAFPGGRVRIAGGTATVDGRTTRWASLFRLVPDDPEVRPPRDIFAEGDPPLCTFSCTPRTSP